MRGILMKMADRSATSLLNDRCGFIVFLDVLSNFLAAVAAIGAIFIIVNALTRLP